MLKIRSGGQVIYVNMARSYETGDGPYVIGPAGPYVPPVSGDSILLEDGVSFLLLENGVDNLLLEGSAPAVTTGILLEDGISFLLLENGTDILLQE